MRTTILLTAVITLWGGCSQSPPQSSDPAAPAATQPKTVTTSRASTHLIVVENMVGHIDDLGVAAGCACVYDKVFASDIGMDRAWIVIDDQLTKLQLVRAIEDKSTKSLTEYYSAGTDVSVVVTPSKVKCSPPKNVCEGASIETIKGNRKQIITAVGNCGC